MPSAAASQGRGGAVAGLRLGSLFAFGRPRIPSSEEAAVIRSAIMIPMVLESQHHQLVYHRQAVEHRGESPAHPTIPLQANELIQNVLAASAALQVRFEGSKAEFCFCLEVVPVLYCSARVRAW